MTYYKYPVVFVGSKGYHPEFPYRLRLLLWLERTYGEEFTQFGGGGVGNVRGHDLNRVYASTKVVVGDTLCLGFDYPDYFSDRVFETTGRGGFIIHPRIRGIERCFVEDEEIVLYTYGDFDELQEKIDYYLEHDEERERIRLAGHERTKRDHTYTERWTTILETI